MEDTEHLCRVCGNSLYKRGHRMDKYIGRTSLEQMLSYCTKTDISGIDGAPYSLCTQCRDDLIVAHGLIVLYHKTAQRWLTLNKQNKSVFPVEKITFVTSPQNSNCILEIEQSSCLSADPIGTTNLEENDESLFKRSSSTSFPSAQLNFDETDYENATELVQERLKFRNTNKKPKKHRKTCDLDDFIAHHWSDRRPKCCGCYAEFDTCDLLKAHSNSVHKPDLDTTSHTLTVDQKQFSCDICYRRYKTRRILLDHKQRPYRTKQYQCTRCGKAFRDKCSVDDHERVHQDERPFVCGICSKTFAMKDSYRKHLRLHTVESDRFKCEVCGKGCRTKGNLKDHYTTHTIADRPLQCPLCTSQFTRKSCLKSHMRLHTGEKPYKCDLCAACYTFSSDLRRHVMAHKGIKPFVCDVCDRAYPRKDYLAKHIASSHSLDPQKIQTAANKRTSGH